MPSPNAANKSTAKKAAEKNTNVDLGQKLAKRKSQDFKSKIAAWDQQGQDEVVVLEDEGTDVVDFADVGIVVEPENEDPAKDAKAGGAPATPRNAGAARKAASKPTPVSKAKREVDSGRKAWVRRKSKAAIDSKAPAGEEAQDESPNKVDVTPEVKRAVAPKKRVVSDGHWRRDRQRKDAAVSPEKEEKKEEVPKPVMVRRSVMNAGLKFPPSVQTFVDEQEREPVRRRHLKAPSRSRSRSREPAEKDSTLDYESSGMKVYIKRRRRSKNDDTSGSSLTAGSSLDRPSTGTDITTPDDTPPKSSALRPRSEPRERTSGKYDRLQKSSPKLHTDGGEAPRRVSRNKTKDDLDMPKPLRPHNATKSTPKLAKIPAATPNRPNTAPKVFGNRIEGWLSGMQDDPFTEATERSLTPEPLDIRRKKSKAREDTENDYDVNRRESGGHPRARRSRPSLGQIDTNERSRPASGPHGTIEDWVHNSSPDTPTLKRSGARRNMHSPVKDRTGLRASPSLDEDSTISDPPQRKSRRRAATTAYDKPMQPVGSNARKTRALPSRPRGPSDASDQRTVMEGSVASDGESMVRSGSGLKRRLTKHSDLMSVLSLPRAEEQRTKTSRSVRRSRRGPSGAMTLGETMNEISAEELKYQRELRTMVDGVIPVLLAYVLSKKDSKRGPGARKSSMQDSPELTKPIVDMGVALERLKTQHKRIPMHDPHELLLWAQSSAKVYSDYLQAWRLGFSDVVVNLAPAEGDAKGADPERWDSDYERNAKGDLLNGNGERVDVAYLLKRPLVRVKNLSKTLKGINNARPSDLAAEMESTYNDLVADAKQRANDERARLEDEAAAAIDPTRARELRNLGPLSGVNIDPTRSVRARDYFDMQLYHSSGQQLDCKVELIMRDDAPMRGTSGDILFCEVSTSGRWLLFPPVLATRVSARDGDKEGEIVVMIRGVLSSDSEWREIMSLVSTDEQNEEWLGMLASDPMPPRLTRQSSFNALRKPSVGGRRPPSPTESELPLGERARGDDQRWNGSDVNSSVGEIPPSSLPKARASRYHGQQPSPLAREISPPRGTPSGPRARYAHTRAKSEFTVSTDTSSYTDDRTVYSDETSTIDSRHQRPGMQRRTSSVPSLDLPTIPKLRHTTPRKPRTNDEDRDDHADPKSVTPKVQKRRKSPSREEKSAPSHGRTTSIGLRTGILPSFTPAFLKSNRRSSSPLKHEYEPSTASDTSSDSELSDVHEVESLTSDSEAEDEVVSTIGDLRDFGKFGTVKHTPRPASRSNASVAGETLGPSDSASQGPYRGVPAPPKGAGTAKSVASILAWSETGAWVNMHPEQCEIVVRPGVIEAFDLAQAHAVAPNSTDVNEPSPSARGVRPLVELELTPLVPIRRGTAVDISIRSPPTTNSVIRKGNNIMFRSRNPEECEKLYQLINRARIDNPTWIALQNARPVQTSNWGEAMDRRNAARTSADKSWLKSLSRKGSSYRSKGNRSASIAASQSSVGTMNSAFSALRRFSGGSKIFNIAKSTIHSRGDGTRSSSAWTGSDSLSSGAQTPVPMDPRMGTPVGITDTRIRLYFRENASKWQDMGPGRLTIMFPPRPAPGTTPADPRKTGMEKRIVVSGKTADHVLLDATLGESAFERIARTGIAVSIWEDSMYAPQTGGVAGARSKVYMLQMKSERDAAYTFSMVGKLRY